MKKTILIVLSLVLVLGLCSCGSSASGGDNSMNGKWQLCGMVEPADEESGEAARDIIDEEFMDLVGLTEMPESYIVIDENGLKDTLESVGDTEISPVEKIDDNQFKQTAVITEVNGEKLDDPIVETYTVELKGEFLYLTLTYDSEEFDGANTNIYRRAE